MFLFPPKRGYFPGPHDQAFYPKIIQFHSELKQLEHIETMLDQHIFWVEQSIKDTKEDCNQYPAEKPFCVLCNCVCSIAFLLPLLSLTVYLKTWVHRGEQDCGVFMTSCEGRLLNLPHPPELFWYIFLPNFWPTDILHPNLHWLSCTWRLRIFSTAFLVMYCHSFISFLTIFVIIIFIV